MKLSKILAGQMVLLFLVLSLCPEEGTTKSVVLKRTKRFVWLIPAIAAISAAVSAGAAVAAVVQNNNNGGNGGGNNPPPTVCYVQRRNYGFCLRQMEELRYCPVGRGCCCE